MPGYDDLRADALELFGQAITAARRADATETLRRLVAGRDRLADSLLTVVVCGEFKRGKSTLLNALLEQRDELFPVGVSYTTSLVTTVVHGGQERITVRLASDGAGTDARPAEIEELVISRAELRDYVTQDGNPGNEKRVLSADIELPSDQLVSGLVLVDTPGIGGVYTRHTAVTNEVLPLADAIVFVADVHQPLTATEIRFLRRAVEAARVGNDPDALICVLTKTDQVAGYDETVARTQARIAEATGWPRVPVVPVSSQAKIEYLSSDDEADLADSNFPALERVLWDTVTRRRARAVLARALQDVDGAATALLEPVNAELKALLAAGPEAAAAVRETIEARRRHLAGLGVAAAFWRGDLVRSAEDMGREVSKRTLEHADRAWRNVPGYLADNAMLDHSDRLFQRIDEELSLITGIADRMLYDRAALLQRELAGQLGLDLGRAEIRRLPAAPVPAVRAPGPAAEVGRPRRRPAEPGTPDVTSIGSTVGSVLGRLIEMFRTPGAGARIGETISATASVVVSGAVKLARWRTADSPVWRQPRGEVRRQLHADLDEYYQQVLRPHITSHVTMVTSEWEAMIAAEIDSRIRQEQASAAESARRLSEPTPQDAERAAAREAALKAAQEPLEELRRRVGELAQAAAELAHHPGAAPDGAGAGGS